MPVSQEDALQAEMNAARVAHVVGVNQKTLDELNAFLEAQTPSIEDMKEKFHRSALQDMGQTASIMYVIDMTPFLQASPSYELYVARSCDQYPEKIVFSQSALVSHHQQIGEVFRSDNLKWVADLKKKVAEEFPNAKFSLHTGVGVHEHGCLTLHIRIYYGLESVKPHCFFLS